jgi:hypothetical protein
MHQPTADPRNGQQIKDLRHSEHTLLELCETGEGNVALKNL